MLYDSCPGGLLIGVVHRSISLEVIRIQHLSLEPYGTVLQSSQTVIKVRIDRSRIDYLLSFVFRSILYIKIIHAGANLYAIKHILNHPGVASHGYTLEKRIKIVVVKCISYGKSLNDKCRKLAAGTSPLLSGVALNKLLVDIRTHKAYCLLLQVLRLSNSRRFSLLFNLGLCLLWRHHTPHLIEGIHIERQAVKFALVIGHGSIGESVKFNKSVNIVPHLTVVGMENVCPVFVNVNPFNLTGKYISRNVVTLVYNKNLLALVRRFSRKYSAEKSGAHYQIIVHSNLLI